MCPECQRLLTLRIESLDNLCPQHTCGAHLCNLHEMVHSGAPEERQTRSESINIEARLDTCAQVIPAVSESIGKLNVASSTSLLHVIAGD